MYTNSLDYLITFLISLIPIAMVIVCDKFYPFFNSGKEKHQIETIAPKILFSKISDMTVNNINSTILSVSIECIRTSVDDKNEEKEITHLKFTEIDSVSEANDICKYGIRLSNQTNDGLSFNVFCTKNNEKISFYNCPFRHIDPSKSLVLVFALHDRPNQIEAKFKDFKLTYSFNATTTGYVSPKAEKLRK